MNKRILIAEDEVPLAKALQLKLGSSGFDVLVVGNGAEVLKALDTGTFDLLLLDLIMPVMDGYTVLEKIGKTKPDMRIIVLTNLGQEEDKKRVEAYGVAGFFVKSDTPIKDIVNYINILLAHGTAK